MIEDDATDALQALVATVKDLGVRLENAHEVAHSFRRMYEQARVENARLRALNGAPVPADVLEVEMALGTEHLMRYTGGKSSGYLWTCTCGAKSLRYIDKEVRTWDAVEHIASTINHS